MRTGKEVRRTNEVDIEIEVNLDGEGLSKIDTPIDFLNHLLSTFSLHSKIDMRIKAKGDLKHHLAEDIALSLGKAIGAALGDRSSIRRFGWAIVPMDDSLVLASTDLVRRPFSMCSLNLTEERIEDMASQDITHFLASFAVSLGATIHIHTICGANNHHKAEAAFKALAVALRTSMSLDWHGQEITSVKGIL